MRARPIIAASRHRIGIMQQSQGGHGFAEQRREVIRRHAEVHGDGAMQVDAESMQAREIIEHGFAEAGQLRPVVDRAAGGRLEPDVEGFLVIAVVAGVERFGLEMHIAAIAAVGVD